MYDPYDHYFNKAKKEWYKARSAFKIEEIDQKYKFFTKDTKTVLDVGCSPGSWTQYTHRKLTQLKVQDFKIVWFDLKKTDLKLPWVYSYEQDITETESVDQKIKDLWIEKFDCIISDMAPNTMWFRDVDAIRSIVLLEKTLWLYESYLKDWGKFMIKVFMWPWFEEFLNNLRKVFGQKWIKVFKPQACRTESKETYIVRY